MPVKITKNKAGSFKVSTPKKVHAKATTYKNALAQERLLNAIDHGFKPNAKMAKKKQ